MLATMPTPEAIRAGSTGGRSDDLTLDEVPAQEPAAGPEDVDSLATHRARLQERTRADNARFWLAAIADSSDDAIVGKDLHGIVTSWNKAAETMFGYTSEEMIGQPVARIIPQDRINEEAAILERISRSEKIAHFETKRQRKDGTIIPTSLTVSSIRDDTGNVIGISKIARDLSETQRVHRDLERREGLLHSILDTVPDALIVIDRQRLIHSFSNAAVRLFGYTAAEMRGQRVSTLLPAHEQEQQKAARGEYDATDERHIIGSGRRKDGSTFPMELTVGEVNLPGTQLFTAFVHDLSDQASRERELSVANIELERLARSLAVARLLAEQSNHAKSRFLATMSHELRTPLNGMLGYAQLLRLEGGLNEAQTGRVEAMLGAGKHLLRMIGSVLDLSKIEAKQVDVQPVQADILAIATACLDVVRPSAEARHLVLRLAVAPGFQRELTTDATRLRQILLNLLGNAVKFTSKGTVELRMRTIAGGSVMRIEVADTGPGIPANHRQRLFQDFERINTDATRSAEGAGLGLSLSSRLATLLGGTLGHHDNPGGGSVFWLELPVEAAAESPPAMPPAANMLMPPPATLHVLVVDDIAMNRDIAGSFLRAAGHKVTCAETGAEAVTAAKTMDFNVILMDVRMPEMDGLEATRRIRALDGKRGRVPIVALTAQAFSEQMAECRKAGMDSHLPKPFDPDTLLDAVLRANAAGPMHSDNFDLATSRDAKSSAPPVAGSDLLVCNLNSFDRTTCYIAPERVAAYLETIAETGEALLRELRGPGALAHRGDELAEAAHAIAGSAGLFGFERLTAVGRRFEQAVQTGAAEVPALADGLTAALEVTLHTIHDRPRTTTDA